MNLSLPGVVMLVAGAVLCYAAVNNVDPRDVIRVSLMKKEAMHGPLAKAFVDGAKAGARELNQGATQNPPSTGYGTGTQGVWV